MGIAEQRVGGIKEQSLASTPWGGCKGSPVPSTTVFGVGEGGRAASGQLQYTGPRRHGMAVCRIGLDVHARSYSEALSARNDLTVFDAFHKVFKFAAGSQTFRPDQQGCPTAIDAFPKRGCPVLEEVVCRFNSYQLDLHRV